MRKELTAEDRTLGNGLSTGDQKRKGSLQGRPRGENSYEENQQDVEVLAHMCKEESKIPTRVQALQHCSLHLCSAVILITGLGTDCKGALVSVSAAAASWLSLD